MIVARTRDELAPALRELRGGGRLALVPTMGYLHEGHLSLVDLGRREAASVVATIFVNPLQFGPSEDFARYPRDEARDLALLESRGADLVFVPEVEEVYPDGTPRVTVWPGAMADVLCGAYRPGHFEGVLTVVAKLFGLVRPDVAVFGRKDYQQAVLVRRMVRDLELGVEIVTAPIVREEDGLAMSSRNAYLSAGERADAVGLHHALARTRAAFREGERDPAALARVARDELRRYSSLRPQYVEIVDPDTLERAAVAEKGTVVALAAFAGATRLIDNAVLS